MNRLLAVFVTSALYLTGYHESWAAELTGAELGAPGAPGSIQTNAAGGLVLTGTGAGIGLRRDEGYFAWMQKEGDFDIAVRVESLSAPDLYGRAGLMARVSLDADSPFAAVMATPNVAGILFQSRDVVGAAGRQLGAYPANYPNAWLRLKRVGTQFTGAASADGKTWTRLESTNLEPASIYLGLAITSWSTNATATAVFKDWTDADGAIELASTPFIELPGPCTRRTGLVISEIMFHPIPRTDGRNLEFVELFNSQAIFADVSGYRLANAVDFTFPEGTVLPPGGFVVVARAPADVTAVYGLTNVLGGYASGLDNGAGVVELRNRIGGVLLEATYDSDPEWPTAADGAGHSLVLARPSFGERSVRAWGASGVRGGSPGRWDGSILDGLSRVRINEVRARSRTPDLDYIELYNHSNEPVDLSGAALSDSPTLTKFKIPEGTVIPARGFLNFDENRLGFRLSAAGETVYFTSPDGLRVLDAIRFRGQALGAVYGRTPDGSEALRPLARPTPGESNAGPWLGDIVINEIMYHPITENDDHQYVELYNHGAAPVNLAGWQFTAGIQYTFPAGVVLPAGGYLVVAKNAAELRARNTGLTAANCLGDFSGTLSGRGESIVLSRPEQVTNDSGGASPATETVWVEAARVDYVAGGRWGTLADGGGSSLELKDADADPNLPSNWADSDEANKGEWTLVEKTGLLDLGLSRFGINQLHILLEGVGECLVDNVEVIGPAGTNMVVNGDFEAGLTGWTPQGSHRDSTLETNLGVNGSQCLHLRAESRGDPGANRVRVNVATGLKEGQTATIRAQVRWLRGAPEVLVRLRGNYLEADGHMGIATGLGTPGRANSRAVPNAPPAIYDVAHSPVLPMPGEPVTVTARLHDPDGIGSFTLKYRIDPAVELSEVPMRDDGTAGDAVAGDGLFSATIPGQVAGVIAAFHLVASDASASPANGTFPETAPARECLVRFGEVHLGGSFGTYRIWMTQATRSRWTSREKLSNAPLDVTFVYGNQRAIYNAGSYYAGSPHVAGGYSGPTGALCGYVVHLPEDDRFLGVTEMKLDWPVRDPALQMEQVAYWIAEQMGVPNNHRRFIYLYVNGARRSALYEDAQQPNSDMVAEYFPEDDNGDLYKIDDWFEFDNGASTFEYRDATLQPFTTTDGEKKLARYRWNWRKRAVKESASDYRSLFALVDATQTSSMDEFTRKMEASVDLEEYLRVIAFEHIVGNWDSFGYYRGKNMSTYKPERGKWNLLTWDIDFVLSASGDPATTYPFGTIDPTVSQMMYHPPFQRIYYRALSDAVDGPLQASKFGPLLAAKYAAFVNNGVAASAPTSGSNYLTARMKSLRQLLADVESPLALTEPAVSSPVNLYVLRGTAPVQAKDIRVNGVAYPITWFSPTDWQMRIPLSAATNRLSITAHDTLGRALGSAKTLQVKFTGTMDPPEGHIVFNEIMHHPAVPGGEFVELYNRSASTAYDLSGWQVSGLDYTLPPGSVLEPGAFITLARFPTPFWEAYGPDPVPDGLFAGDLSAQGETLRLIRPGPLPAGDQVIAEVTFGTRPPWPEAASRGGISLQLRDPLRDQNRIGNWSARIPETPTEWEFQSVTGKAASSRLLLYLSGLPPIRDIASIEGSWDGSVNFGQGNSSPFRIEFRPGPTAGTWEGDFIFELNNEEQRSPLGQVIVTNEVLTFGFSVETAEFRFPLTGDLLNLNGRYQPAPENGYPATLKRSNPGGDVYLDDLWLTQGTAAESGTNLIRNGDFELPLESNWTVATNHSASATTGEFKHSGASSLHLAATVGGYAETNAVWQDVLALEPGETYTLSYWLRRGSNANGLVVRLADWSLLSTRDLRPVKELSVTFTPGRPNSTLASLPEFPKLWLNEFAAVNVDGPVDRSGHRNPWVELYNAGTEAVSLASYALGNAYSNQVSWTFPADAVIAPGEFRLVWLDANPSESTASEWHANFRPSLDSGVLILSRQVKDEQQILDYLEYAGLPSGASIGWMADGVPGERVLFGAPTPLAANAGLVSHSVFINEWMAANSQSVADPLDGRYDDWIELFNAGTSPVDLGGYALSDSAADPRKFVFPAGITIPSRGFMVVWADGEPWQSQPGGDQHASFRLDGNGETIVLSGPDGTRLDYVAFGAQTSDLSEGRWPDGSDGELRILTRPTLGAPNVWSNDLRISPIALDANGQIEASWPSTPGQTFRIQFKDDLSSPAWSDFGQPLPAAGPQTTVSLGIPSGGHRFFRIIVEGP